MALATVIVVAAALGLVAGNNIVNPATGMCLDMYAPCEDGSDTKGCTRMKAKDIPKGTHLQAWRCHDKDNQNFEMIGGRLRNKATGMCVDILPPCKDGSEKDDCERGSVSDIGKVAMLQAWPCLEGDSTVKGDNGNQIWDFLENGLVKHEGTELCMDILAHVTESGGRADPEDVKLEAPIQAYTCHSEANQIFDFETGDLAEEAGNATVVSDSERLFQLVGEGLRSPSTAPPGRAVSIAVAGTCILGAGVLVVLRSRRSTAADGEPCREAPE